MAIDMMFDFDSCNDQLMFHYVIWLAIVHDIYANPKFRVSCEGIGSSEFFQQVSDQDARSHHTYSFL
jgi:hypothetical protein